MMIVNGRIVSLSYRTFSNSKDEKGVQHSFHLYGYARMKGEVVRADMLSCSETVRLRRRQGGTAGGGID